jgi:hypothetical protein
MELNERVASVNGQELKYKLSITDKITKKERYLDLYFTEDEVINMLKNKIYKNCIVLGFPNFVTASGNQVKVFRE